MSEYERHHYVQKALLKNFAIQANNEKYKINVIDLEDNTINLRNIERAFYIKNLYDIHDEDEKKLEKDLGLKIESPFCEVMKKILSQSDEIIITRKELLIIKKYMLIQIYRNLKNSLCYNEEYANKLNGVSRYNINEEESQMDFWKREIQTILDMEWDDLISKCDMVGVKRNAIQLNQNFLMFFKTNNEFLINDVGFTLERMPVNISMSKEDYVNFAQQYGTKVFGVSDFGEIAKKEFEADAGYLDNFIWFSISPNLAIVSVNVVWKQLFIYPELFKVLNILPSPILINHFSLPKNKNVNEILIYDPKTLAKYKNPQDKFIYKINKLNEIETIYINHLFLNEAFRYIGYYSSQGIISSIQTYNILKRLGHGNMKNDYEKIESILVGDNNNLIY